MLEPMVESEVNAIYNSGNKSTGSSGNNKVMLCSTKEFIKGQKKAKFCLELIPKGIQEDGSTNSVPPEIQSLLKEFKKIIVEYLPA